MGWRIHDDEEVIASDAPMMSLPRRRESSSFDPGFPIRSGMTETRKFMNTPLCKGG